MTIQSTDEDRKLTATKKGYLVSGLTDEEYAAFNRCVHDGYAERTYTRDDKLCLARVKLLGA